MLQAEAITLHRDGFRVSLRKGQRITLQLSHEEGADVAICLDPEEARMVAEHLLTMASSPPCPTRTRTYSMRGIV